MKKTMVALLLLITSSIFGQDHFENAFMKLDIVDSVHIQITNKQMCASTFRKVNPDLSIDTTKLLQPDSSVILRFSCCGYVHVTPITDCTIGLPVVGHVYSCLGTLSTGVEELKYIQKGNMLEIHTKFAEKPMKKYYIKIFLEDGTTVKREITFSNLVWDYFVQTINIQQ